jgi:hypothetical protein
MLLALERATIGVTVWPLIFWAYPPFETHDLCPGVYLFFRGEIFRACSDRSCHKENSNTTDLLRVVSEEEVFFAGLVCVE